MTQASAPARRNLVILFAVIAVLVIISLVVVFTRGEPEMLDESTPEGVVQRYSAAVIDGDDETAVGYLSDDAREQCGTVQNQGTDNLRVTLTSTKVRDDSADVRVQMSRHDGSAFGAEYTSEDDFKLVRDGTDWAIEYTPWELNICLMDGEFK